MAVAYDLGDKADTESWLHDFRETFGDTAGFQNPLDFDEFGDARREAFVAIVRDSLFVKIE